MHDIYSDYLYKTLPAVKYKVQCTAFDHINRSDIINLFGTEDPSRLKVHPETTTRVRFSELPIIEVSSIFFFFFFLSYDLAV